MKLNLGQRNALGFSLVILIVLALGLITFIKLDAISGKAHDLAADCYPGLTAANRFNELAKENVGLVYKHIGSESIKDMEGLDVQIKGHQTAGSKLIDEYKIMVKSDKERALYDHVLVTRTAFVQTLNEVLEVSRQATNDLKACARHKFLFICACCLF